MSAKAAGASNAHLEPWFAGVGPTICVLWHNPQFCVMQMALRPCMQNLKPLSSQLGTGGAETRQIGQCLWLFCASKTKLGKTEKNPCGQFLVSKKIEKRISIV